MTREIKWKPCHGTPNLGREGPDEEREAGRRVEWAGEHPNGDKCCLFPDKERTHDKSVKDRHVK